MIDFERVTAFAVIGDAAMRRMPARYQRAVAVAAITSHIAPGAISFSLATHVVGTPAALQHWVDARIADDPVLVGHRLMRMSRLLCAAGLGRSLARSFSAEGRYDITDLHRGRMIPLAISALYADMLSVDERALACRPDTARTGNALATAALINALATWVIFFRRAAAGPDNAVLREKVLTRLDHDLRSGGAVPAVIASLSPAIH